MERFIIECVQNGITRPQLEELFPGQLEGLDEELLRRVILEERLVPASVRWASALPRVTGSNNWALAGARTASGKPLLCNDPHLEINRLPPVWYEVILSWGASDDRHFALGATLPGVPSVIFGRNRDVAWSVTYAFMDCIDSWVEECREGKYRRDGWQAFSTRTEVVARKRHPPVEIVFYENEHGMLEGDPNEPGFYLTTRWSCGENTNAGTLDAACGILTARTVEEGRPILAQLSNASWNWVLADRDGNIGYQMSGKMPRRRAGTSGLVPLPGWDPANDWQGFEPPENLPRVLNPAAGFIATSNHDLNHLGLTRPINLPMASYRADRIEAVLRNANRSTLEDMKALQRDVYSLQGAAFMKLLGPLLSEFPGEPSALLRDWDCTYSSGSKGAFVFEQFYRALFEEVFGSEHALGRDVLQQLLAETGLFFDFYGSFDRVMLSEKSAWFGPCTRRELYRTALARAFSVPVRRYGDTRKVRLNHLLLGSKFPLWFGFDRQIELPGGRATVSQAQVFRSHGRETSFAPSMQIVTDLSRGDLHTTLAGGVADRPFTKLYANRLRDWLRGHYAVLAP
jgi:penicillin amidase